MWVDNEKIMTILDMVNKEKTHFPCKCPVCDKETAHIYIHRHDDRHCGIWVWCSSCGSYSHVSGELPKWWKNPDFVDADQLCSEPEYLETMSGKIDTWVNSIMPDEKPFPQKPLIMENKFKVRLLTNYQNIPAGAVGTLVIKDDFRKISVDFINADGKKINLQIQPETVANFFEVIK
jgi:hypothetical protein